MRKHYAFLGTIKPQQTAYTYHTGAVPTTQVWRSSNEEGEGEVDVEQDKEGKDVATTRVEAPGTARPETM